MKTVELYDIGRNEPTTIEVGDEHRLVDLVEISKTDVLVLVDDSDSDVEFVGLDIATTIAAVSQGKTTLSILRNPHAKVTVHVHYVGNAVEIDVHAATRLRRVRKLAIDALQLGAERGADTVLRLEGSDADLPLKRPVGAYIEKGQRELSLDLAHKVRAQG